jgi:hypothetical protein
MILKDSKAHPPAKPARHLPESQPMADGQGEAAWGVKGPRIRVSIPKKINEYQTLKWKQFLL